MGDSRRKGDYFLGLKEVDLRGFLCDLANLRDGDEARRFDLTKTFPDFLHGSDLSLILTPMVFMYARQLRRAWDAPDRRHRDWYLSTLRYAHASHERDIKIVSNVFDAMNDNTRARGIEVSDDLLENALSRARFLLVPTPEPTPLEIVLYYFQSKVGDRAKRCAYENCRRYFISPKRMGKFCSKRCAQIVNTEDKRKWWAENRGKRAI